MKRRNKNGFAIIEILIGIFIFSLGLVSIYTVISSILRVNEYNKNYIIASNLAREEIELFRNIRDSNYTKIKKYNQINPSNTTYTNVFSTGSYYKIENDYISPAFPIKVEKINNFEEGIDKISGINMKNYKLCLDSNNRYTYNCTTTGNVETFFYRYLKVDEVKSASGVINNALKLKSKVIWYKKGYNEFELNTIITDWKRL